MSARSLKPGWKMVTFGDVVENVVARANPADVRTDIYVGLEHLEPGTLHLRRWGHPSDVTGEKLFFKKGDVIFGRRRAYQRKLAVADCDGICSAHAMVVRAKPDMILPEFLPFFLQSDMFMERAIEISVGSLSPTINWKTMRIQEFPLPPLDEQKRIAEILWAADEAVECYLSLKNALHLKKSTITRKIMPSNVPFSSLRKGIIPGIKASKLKDVCEKITDGTHQSPSFSNYGVPFLLISNIDNGDVNWNVSKWVTEETYAQLTKTTKPEVGDVLFTVVASYGDAVFIDWSKPFAFQRHIAIIKPKHTILDGRFLYYFLRSTLGKKQSEIYAEGLAQKTITLKSLGQFCVPTPPISVQKAICDELDAIEQLIFKCQNTLFDCQALLRQLKNTLIGGRQCLTKKTPSSS
jgi:restriction endonuclease S subunit